MKTLNIFRHGKSGWDSGASRDFDRPINERGIAGSRLMGVWAKEQALKFGAVYCSPAVRCVETLDAFWEGYGEILHPNWDKRIYLASGASLLDWLVELDEEADDILMCGHNPGCEELAMMLVPDTKGDELRYELEEKFPTASMAQVTLPIQSWNEVTENIGTLARFVRPRDLDPSLAPSMD